MRHKARDSGGKFALLFLLCRRVGLLLDKTGHGFTRPHVIGFVDDLFFSSLESGFKNIRIRCRIRRMRVDGSRIRK